MKLLSLLAVTAALLIAPLTQANTTLKIATIAPDGTGWMKLMRQAADEIQAKTDGRVKVRYFPGGIQGSDKSVLRKMQIRQLQGGAVSTGALAQIANITQLYSMPFLFRNLDEIRAIRPEFDPMIEQALAEQGYTLLGLSEGGFAYLMSNTPLRSTTDVRSKKVWVPEGDIISQTTFEKGKVEPISLPVSDVYTSLQTGLIDTIGVNPTTAIALQWHTKVNYATDYPLIFLFGALVVDSRALDKVSEADKKVVRESMKKAFADMDKQNENDEQQAREALIQNGVQFVELTDENKADWRNLAQQSVDALRAKNIYPVAVYQKLLDRLQQLRQQASHQ